MRPYTHKQVGHMFGEIWRNTQMLLLYMIHMVHDTYDAYARYAESILFVEKTGDNKATRSGTNRFMIDMQKSILFA